MSKEAFAQVVIDKLTSAIGSDGSNFGPQTAVQANVAIASAISEYICAHTKVRVAYNGMIPGSPPIADPIIADEFKVAGFCAPPLVATSYNSWIMQLQTNISVGFMLAETGMGGLVFPCTPFTIGGLRIPQGDIQSACMSDGNPQINVWSVICGGIMDWINGSAMNKIPGSANNPLKGSSGMANITKIIIE